MKPMIKNIAKGQTLNFAEEVSYQKGQVVSKTLAQNKHHSLTLFAFDEGEEISTHSAPGDAMILVLDGKAKIVLDGTEHHLAAGQSIVMPKGLPHSVHAESAFKMFLTVIFQEEEE